MDRKLSRFRRRVSVAASIARPTALLVIFARMATHDPNCLRFSSSWYTVFLSAANDSKRDIARETNRFHSNGLFILPSQSIFRLMRTHDARRNLTYRAHNDGRHRDIRFRHRHITNFPL